MGGRYLWGLAEILTGGGRHIWELAVILAGRYIGDKHVSDFFCCMVMNVRGLDKPA